jgi:hypothetical protein
VLFIFLTNNLHIHVTEESMYTKYAMLFVKIFINPFPPLLTCKMCIPNLFLLLTDRDECQAVIGNITEDQDTYLDLDVVLVKACTPMLKQFCGEVSVSLIM